MDIENNPAYGASVGSLPSLPSNDSMYEDLAEFNHSTDYESNDRKNLAVTRVVQEESKKEISRTVSLLLGIGLFTAVLALLLAVVAVGLSIGLNSVAEIHSLTTAMNMLQLRLNHSVDNVEDLGPQTSTVGLQANITVQNGEHAIIYN